MLSLAKRSSSANGAEAKARLFAVIWSEMRSCAITLNLRGYATPQATYRFQMCRILVRPSGVFNEYVLNNNMAARPVRPGPLTSAQAVELRCPGRGESATPPAATQ